MEPNNFPAWIFLKINQFHKAFISIAQVGAAGYSQNRRDYQLKDTVSMPILSKRACYRFEMVDQDRSFQLSKAVEINL